MGVKKTKTKEITKTNQNKRQYYTESIRTLNISKTKMFEARENDCHS